MRTKTLLLTAVLGVAGVAATTAQAQSVYSQNAVGYVTLSLPAGFSMIANPLNNTTNDIQSIITGMPNNTIVYGFNSTSQAYLPSTYRSSTSKWTVDLVLNPGSGIFINLPSAASITFVGNVPQGTLANTIPPGFSIQSYPIPVSVAITNSLIAFPTPNNGDIVYQYSNASGYLPHTYRASTGQYTGAMYTPAVGESFFYLSTATSAKTWSVTFSVN